ncbi:MAG: nitroreductase family protein [Eubacterium sp.]|nr:nitroreductase family protein [Eubacterium sp.]
MKLRDVIADRRSIRKFKSDDLSYDQVMAVLESARLCQSGKNRQPWRFMILKGDDKNRVGHMMLDHMENEIQDGKAAHMLGVSAKAILQAPVLILIFKDKTDDSIKNEGDTLSVGAAIEHMALTAVDLGLGSLWLRQILCVKDEICNFTGYPNLHLLSALALGYADEKPSSRPRKTMEEIILEPKKDSLTRAYIFAEEKHRGQKRKEGIPYITHPLEVSRILKEWGYDEKYQLAGLFHDLLEDTDASEEEIESIGGAEVLRAVKCLTKEEGYNIEDYVDRIKKDPIAFVVKAADRLHNLKSAVYADEKFKRRYIEESMQWYMDFHKDIADAVEDLKKTLEESYE